MPVYMHEWDRSKLPSNRHTVSLKGADVHRNCVLHQPIGRQILKNSADLRVALLHRDNFFNVLNVAPKLIGFLKKLRILRYKEFSKLGEVPRQLLSVRIVGEIFGQVPVTCCQKGGRFGEI